jgi:hypothetical protein
MQEDGRGSVLYECRHRSGELRRLWQCLPGRTGVLEWEVRLPGGSGAVRNVVHQRSERQPELRQLRPCVWAGDFLHAGELRRVVSVGPDELQWHLQQYPDRPSELRRLWPSLFIRIPLFRGYLRALLSAR